MKSKLITSAQLSGYRPRRDKSLSISFVTGEKSPGEVMDIHSKLDDFGYLVFKSEEKLTKEEIAELDSLDTDLYDNPKTQSKRLRDVLFLNWQQNNKGYPEFKEYYKQETEIIITHYKGKLPERN